MKVEKTKKGEKLRSISLQIRPSVLDAVDKVAKSSGVPRQKLIEAILEQALNDKNFVLKV